MTYKEFYDQKWNDRVSHLRNKSNKRSDKREVKDTHVIKNYDSEFNIARGSHFLLKVNVEFNIYELKRAAVEKKVQYNSELESTDVIDYQLSYKNGEVVRCIPGTQTPSVLKDYNDYVGLSYAHITL